MTPVYDWLEDHRDGIIPLFAFVVLLAGAWALTN
jgi:hypothetical protein